MGASEKDSNFWWDDLGEDFIFDEWLLSQLEALPRRDEVTLEIFDYDGTLTNDRIRFDILPILEHHRWKDAYKVIGEKLGTQEDPTGFNTMIERLHTFSFIFSNVDDFYDPENPLHQILSAWDDTFQNGKITRSFWENARRNIVLNAEDKPNEMLRMIIDLGYVPNIVFYDDRIWYFKERGIDNQLRSILGTDVKFLRATPDYIDNVVMLEWRTQGAVAWVLAEV